MRKELFKYRSKRSVNWLDMKGMREKAYRQNKPGMREKVKREEFWYNFGG